VTRSAADPPGALAGGETTLQAGLGVQVNSLGRWGDYSAMSSDPFPECTFWYTQEYYANTASFDFKTRVGSFTFPGCGPSLLLRPNGDAGEGRHLRAVPARGRQREGGRLHRRRRLVTRRSRTSRTKVAVLPADQNESLRPPAVLVGPLLRHPDVDRGGLDQLDHG
jgi:hypothetical protein